MERRKEVIEVMESIFSQREINDRMNREAEKRGERKAEVKMATLVQKLILTLGPLGRTNEIAEAASSPESLMQLASEFGIQY